MAKAGGTMVSYIVAGLVIVLLGVLVLAAATGRVRVRSCCAVADPSKDLRMRTAFGDDLN